jgi:hypothetical protein
MEQHQLSDSRTDFIPVVRPQQCFDDPPPEQVAKNITEVYETLGRSQGASFYEETKKILCSKGLNGFDNDRFRKILSDILEGYSTLKCMQGISLDGLSEDEKKREFKIILQKVCTELYLEKYRNELSGWINYVERGKALFVDCPMGVGKTYSIVKILGQNPNLSAIVFMPTKKLCRRLVQDLKSEILKNNPEIALRYRHVRDTEEGDGEDENEFEAIVGISFRYTREYLGYEVYYADGIVPDKPEDYVYIDDPYQGGCIHFDEIVKSYRKNWITKKDICENCSKKYNCRFVRHDTEAPKARIIITTHAQYERFCRNEDASYWIKDGDPEKAAPRDLFIVDEDILFSRCYTPVYLDKSELDEFIPIITKFLSKYKVGNELNQKIYSLVGQISACRDTSFVKPIDPSFRIPDGIRKSWIFSSLKLIRVHP